MPRQSLDRPGRRAVRVVRRVLTALVIVIAVAVAICAAPLWMTLPRSSDAASIAGLTGPVEITYDRDGVPRIRAATETDAAAALGYAHARDRMFQMELMRRTGSGRLSEFAGALTMPIDKQMRVLGLRRRAEAEWEAASSDVRAILEAYARGVNAWINARGRFSALECLFFAKPETWTPVDSLLWGKLMALWLSTNWHTEFARLSLSNKLPQSLIYQLWPPDHSLGRPEAAAPMPQHLADAGSPRAPVRFPAPFTQPDRASNAWAVTGRRTETGAPLLAGDPHLAFGFPSIWHLARIELPGRALAGATSPGAPFLVIGHNSRIAWTFTTTGADTQDLFIETPAEDGFYQAPDGPRRFETRREQIKVRGQPDVFLTVRETRHGPVVSDLFAPQGPVLALAAANLAPGDASPDGLLALNRAASIEDARRAAPMIMSPVQNLVVADREHIGLFVTGRIPIRRSGDGSAPVPGAGGAYDWIGWASGKQLPQHIDPPSGWLLNANERIAPPEFPVFLGRDWFADWRARRIRQLLDSAGTHTASGFARMQVDDLSLSAQELLPVLRRTPAPPGLPARALALLTDWNGAMDRALPQPLIYNVWLAHIRDALFARNQVPVSAAGPWIEFVSWALLAPDAAAWCGGDCATLLTQTLAESAAYLEKRFGPDPAAWRWGAAHQAVFAHPVMGNLPLLGRLTTARIPMSGDDATLDRGGTPWNGLESIHGAAFRGVYDLADLDRSLFVVAPGQSGNPLSSHARDFLGRWRDGRTITLGPHAEAVTATIRLTPQ